MVNGKELIAYYGSHTAHNVLEMKAGPLIFPGSQKGVKEDQF